MFSTERNIEFIGAAILTFIIPYFGWAYMGILAVELFFWLVDKICGN